MTKLAPQITDAERKAARYRCLDSLSGFASWLPKYQDAVIELLIAAMREPAWGPPVSRVDGFTDPEMTLRDWFAGQALAAMPRLGDTDAGVNGIAHDAYLMADAILETRARPRMGQGSGEEWWVSVRKWRELGPSPSGELTVASPYTAPATEGEIA